MFADNFKRKQNVIYGCLRKIIFSLIKKEKAHDMLPEGGPLPRPEIGLLSNSQKLIVRGDIRADKAKDFIGKGCLGREHQGKGTQEDCSAAWLTVSSFMVMGLAFRVVSGQSSCLCPYLV